jgi:hypothetical protein
VGNFLTGHNLLVSEEEEQLAGGRAIYMSIQTLTPSHVSKNVTPKLIYLNNAKSGVKKKCPMDISTTDHLLVYTG